MVDRHIKSDENRKTIYIDATNLYGQSMPQMLPSDKIEMWNGPPYLYMDKLQGISNTPGDRDFGSFIEIGLRCSDDIKQKTRIFLFCPENNVTLQD